MADGSRTSSRESSEEKTFPSWARWILPSAADMIFVAVLTALVFTALSVRLLGDAGIGWHIRTGQLILETHTIPRVDPFSSSMAGRPWVAWEWLYDIVCGQLEHTAGLNGVTWLTALIIAAVFAWMFRLLVLRETNFFFALLLVLLALSASTVHFLARPHVLSWLLTLAWFWILDSAERDSLQVDRGANRLWILPLLMVLWVNIHGGFVLGFVLLAVFWIGSLWTWLSAKENRIEAVLARLAARRRTRDLLWVGLASFVASFANPYGWKLHQHVYAYLTNRFLMDHIDEFQSPNFHGAAPRCFLALMLIVVAVLLARGRQLRLSHAGLALFAIYSGLMASRSLPTSSILLAMIVGPLVTRLGLFNEFAGRMKANERSLKVHVWPVLAIVVTFFIAANGGRVGSDRLMDAHFDPARMPVKAVDYIVSHQVSGPILAPDSWGGYVIYRLYPRQQPVLDDRHDLYGSEFLKSYLRMIHVEAGWEDFLREHDPVCILLPRNSALANILLKTAPWKVVYTDAVSVILVKH
jgi:hypothetical protein